VQITTDDDEAAIGALQDRMGLAAEIHDGMVTFGVTDGQKFVPRLFAELGVPIRSVQVARPSLDDVFMSYTGRTIRDAEASSTDHNRAFVAAFRR
jgi:ABC-2 type transport system ATP-binding protein